MENKVDFTIPDAVLPFLTYWNAVVEEYDQAEQCAPTAIKIIQPVPSSTVALQRAVAAFEAGWRAADDAPLDPETIELLARADEAIASAERTIAAGRSA